MFWLLPPRPQTPWIPAQHSSLTANTHFYLSPTDPPTPHFPRKLPGSARSGGAFVSAGSPRPRPPTRLGRRLGPFLAPVCGLLPHPVPARCRHRHRGHNDKQWISTSARGPNCTYMTDPHTWLETSSLGCKSVPAPERQGETRLEPTVKVPDWGMLDPQDRVTKAYALGAEAAVSSPRPPPSPGPAAEALEGLPPATAALSSPPGPQLGFAATRLSSGLPPPSPARGSHLRAAPSAFAAATASETARSSCSRRAGRVTAASGPPTVWRGAPIG